MRLQYTERFRRAYSSLAPEQRKRVQRALRLLAEDPGYPGLRVKKIQGAEGIWEARASRSLRITFEVHGNVLILRNVGPHNATLRRP